MINQGLDGFERDVLEGFGLELWIGEQFFELLGELIVELFNVLIM